MTDAVSVPLLIVGGGIGGIATALALARAGRRVHVIERAPEFGEIGAGLQIAPNALRVLDKLGVHEAVERIAIAPSKLSLLDIYSGELLKVVDVGAPFSEHFGFGYLLVHRSDLLQILIDACMDTGLVTLEAGREVSDVIDHGESAEVRCASGHVYRCEGLIAADGLWSVIRTTMFSDEPAKPNGYVAYRGTVARGDLLPHSGPNDLLFWVGEEVHLVQYPLRQQELLNQVVVFKSKHFNGGSNEWGSVNEMEERFAGTHSSVRAALGTIGRDRCWQLHDRAPLTRWVRNRIVLTGDAAHPMFQFLAQGACQALEDATCLAEMLDAHESYERAFLAFQNTRFLRTAMVQTVARYADEFWHAGGVMAEARNAYLKNHPSNRYDEMDWLYGTQEPRGPLPGMGSVMPTIQELRT